ncbi:glypican-5 [Rhipicephalus sanguineus]|uniref:glypican-5 n=1 Tax=Rhipicephalus sanguineus TaxID=34632 RepID=UPI0018935396|nr:glypican-5 [Rhipicephalus sanguineus]
MTAVVVARREDPHPIRCSRRQVVTMARCSVQPPSIGIPFVVCVVLAAFAVVCCGATTDCSAPRDLLSSTLGGGDHRWTEVLAASPTSGDSLTLCPLSSGRNTCCTHDTELRLREAAWDHFRFRLRDATAPLRRFLDDSLALFRERLTSLVSEAERNTEILFSDVYAERVAVEARAPVRRLFRALRHRLGLPLGASDGAESARKDSEDDPVDAFFGELFPLVYFHTVNPRLADFSDDYKACLRGAQGRLRPFGDAPLRLKGSLAESLGAVRTVLRATRLALEVVNASSSPPDDAESHCSRALARALGCGACTSLPPTTVGKVAKRNGKASTLAPTCSGLCVNAARGGCLAALEDLEAPWNDLVSSLHRLLPRLVGAYSLDEALSLLDSRVSEAVIHAMENGPELVKRVKLECGDPRRRPGGANRTELPAATGRRTSGATLRGADAALRSRQRELLRQLSTSRTLFSSLAGAVCDPDVVAPPPCWNGIQIGRYVKPVAAPGIAAQHENPEARHQVSTWDSWLDTHARRLKEMTTEILSHKVSMMPESDSYVMEGSGSGAWGGEDTSDDEDFDSGSGSGYGPGEESPTPTTHVTTSTTPRPKAGGSATPHVAAAALIVAVVCSLLSTFAT